MRQLVPERFVVKVHEGVRIGVRIGGSETLPEADWDAKLVPVIYLPDIAKSDLRNLSQADPEIAPLMEYQYTGTLWIHRNGKEWTVNTRKQLNDLSDEMIAKINVQYYTDLKDCLLKALVE